MYPDRKNQNILGNRILNGNPVAPFPENISQAELARQCWEAMSQRTTPDLDDIIANQDKYSEAAFVGRGTDLLLGRSGQLGVNILTIYQLMDNGLVPNRTPDAEVCLELVDKTLKAIEINPKLSGISQQDITEAVSKTLHSLLSQLGQSKTEEIIRNKPQLSKQLNAINQELNVDQGPKKDMPTIREDSKQYQPEIITATLGLIDILNSDGSNLQTASQMGITSHSIFLDDIDHEQGTFSIEINGKLHRHISYKYEGTNQQVCRIGDLIVKRPKDIELSGEKQLLQYAQEMEMWQLMPETRGFVNFPFHVEMQAGQIFVFYKVGKPRFYQNEIELNIISSDDIRRWRASNALVDDALIINPEITNIMDIDGNLTLIDAGCPRNVVFSVISERKAAGLGPPYLPETAVMLRDRSLVFQSRTTNLSLNGVEQQGESVIIPQNGILGVNQSYGLSQMFEISDGQINQCRFVSGLSFNTELERIRKISPGSVCTTSIFFPALQCIPDEIFVSPNGVWIHNGTKIPAGLRIELPQFETPDYNGYSDKVFLYVDKNSQPCLLVEPDDTYRFNDGIYKSRLKPEEIATFDENRIKENLHPSKCDPNYSG